MRKGEQSSYETELHTGEILIWSVSGQQDKKLFSVVGATHEETALVRLISDAKAIPPELSSMHEIRHKVNWRNESGVATLFADLSKMIVKKKADIANAVMKYPGTIAGALSGQDIDVILQRLLEEKTISRELKHKFLP